ncbi:substrate-binding domain-containing protein [uncultured Cocleimonas sp.]|uniref:substrate-binding domain-containing protein n=1 Tax=uncultured Cocleimonas sp. TaxID=1051587 RepID=UPI0026071C28|nr:substrate-binding domain-containing protein [uncultured Cocleimonas sp.]
MPDDEQSGYQLAKVLVTQARRKGIQDKDGKINIIAINGNHRSLVPKSREKGLKRFVNENADVKLLHVVNAYWSQDRAQGAVERLLKLYPETNIIWSASDWMALGAISGAETMQRRVGKDILICGIDWLPVSFDQINKDHLACSIGGHIFDGAWLMVLLHDQFNHLYPQYVQEQTHFTTVTSKNLSVIETIFKDELWKNIDFKKFSKAYNNNGPVTEFGSHLLIKELVNSKLLMNELN